MKRRNFIQGLAVPLASALAAGAHAQTVTTAPTRITSTLPVGSGPDTVARLVAEKLTARWKQPVVVDAKPGGAGVVAINAMKNLPPTGNELVLADVGNLSINPLIFKNLRYDPERELVPVALMFRTAFFLVVGTGSKLRSVRDLIDASRNAQQLTYGSNAVGGPIHLASAQLESAIGATMAHVAFKETSQLYVSVSTGEVDWAFGSIATVLPLLKAGRVRLLAVADRARSSAAPDVPTLAEAGGPPNLDAFAWNGFFAPAGTPRDVVLDINKAVIDALAQPDVAEKLATFSFTPQALTPQQLGELMRSDRARYAEVLKRVKVSVD
ncbi:MAG: Bug family tripartite tricarboxylate transporter substrate binding protein [Ramlibacter sp.]